MIWVHVGGFANVMDAVGSVADVNVVAIGEFGVGTFVMDERGGVPKILAPV